MPKNEAEQYAKSINALYRCVSALKTEGGGINELFETLGRNLITKKFYKPPSDEDGEKKNIVLSKKKEKKDDKNPKKGKCC